VILGFQPALKSFNLCRVDRSQLRVAQRLGLSSGFLYTSWLVFLHSSCFESCQQNCHFKCSFPRTFTGVGALFWPSSWLDVPSKPFYPSRKVVLAIGMNHLRWTYHVYLLGMRTNLSKATPLPSSSSKLTSTKALHKESTSHSTTHHEVCPVFPGL